MAMSEAISRRSAILRMIAAIGSTKLLAWETLRDTKPACISPPMGIVPGERYGDLFLDMTGSEVVSLLGSPCGTQSFEAEDLEETLRVFAYVNKMTRRNLTAKDAFPLRPAMTFFNYDRLGLSVGLVNDRVTQIHAYTGVVSGYVEVIHTSNVPHNAAFINSSNEIVSHFGKPDNEHMNEYAPIPEVQLYYDHGISFNCRADDGRLATITIAKRKN
jgi:hypothetical protein